MHFKNLSVLVVNLSYLSELTASPYIITEVSFAIQKGTIVVISIFLDTVGQGWYVFFVHSPSSDHPADCQQGRRWATSGGQTGWSRARWLAIDEKRNIRIIRKAYVQDGR